jgi:hypothetical protein
MRPSMPSVIPAIANVTKAKPKCLLMIKIIKTGIRRTRVRVRILGRFMAELLYSGFFRSQCREMGYSYIRSVSPL